MTDWQPIETVPKNGTTVDLFGTRNWVPTRFPNAVWREDCRGGQELGSFSWHHPSRDMYGTFKYTHWMPEPEPPS